MSIPELSSGLFQEASKNPFNPGYTAVLQVLEVRPAQSSDQQGGSVITTHRGYVSDGIHFLPVFFPAGMNYLIESNQLVATTICEFNLVKFTPLNSGKRVLTAESGKIVGQPGVKIGKPANGSRLYMGEGQIPEDMEQIESELELAHQQSKQPQPHQFVQGQQQFGAPLQKLNQFQQQYSNTSHQSLPHREQKTLGLPQNPQPSYQSLPHGEQKILGLPQVSQPFGVDKSPYSSMSHNDFRNSGENETGISYTKIDSINPFQTKWTIKASVSYKSDIRSFKNSKGDGQLFSIHLVDDSGEIKATGFNEDVTKYYDMFTVGKTYTLSQLRVNSANKKFSNLSHDYELMFNQTSEVQLCNDSAVKMETIYHFIPINEIQDKDVNSIVDVLAVVKDPGVTTEITSKAGKQMTKREVTLVDTTMCSIRVTLWDQHAVNFHGVSGSILAGRGLRVGEFNGKNLNYSQGSMITLNPNNLEKGYLLKNWWDSIGCKSEFKGFAGNSGASYTNLPVTSLDKIVKDPDMLNEQTKLFKCVAQITFLRDNPTYPACPGDKCNKKLTEGSTGEWFCSKCDRSYDRPVYRYIAQANISDGLGEIWVQMFDEQAQALLGGSANDYEETKNTNPNALTNLIASVSFKLFTFVVSGKLEVYQDNSRARFVVRKIAPVDDREYSNELIESIMQTRV